MNSSKIKVGSLIQLPKNNFKPNKRSSKKVIKSQIDPKLIQNNLSDLNNRSTSLPALKSGDTIKNSNELNDSFKSNNEETERKLNEFVDKIKAVFNKKLIGLKYKKQILNEKIEKDICSIVPPFEWFFKDRIDLNLRKKKFFEYLTEDDYLIGLLVTVNSSISRLDTKKACFRLMCFDGCKRRLIHDLAIHSYCLIEDDCSKIGELIEENKNNYFRFKVHKVIREQVFVTFNHSPVHHNEHLKLGLIGYDDLPEHFKQVIDPTQQACYEPQNYKILTLDAFLHSNKQYQNPFSVDYLLETLQINEGKFFKKFDERKSKK